MAPAGESIDNDDDGLVDEENPDCNEGVQKGEFCDGGEDNDGDGDVDSEDDDCPSGTAMATPTATATTTATPTPTATPTATPIPGGSIPTPNCIGEGDDFKVAAGGGDITGNDDANNSDNFADVHVPDGQDSDSNCDFLDATPIRTAQIRRPMVTASMSTAERTRRRRATTTSSTSTLPHSRMPPTTPTPTTSTS